MTKSSSCQNQIYTSPSLATWDPKTYDIATFCYFVSGMTSHRNLSGPKSSTPPSHGQSLPRPSQPPKPPASTVDGASKLCQAPWPLGCEDVSREQIDQNESKPPKSAVFVCLFTNLISLNYLICVFAYRCLFFGQIEVLYLLLSHLTQLHLKNDRLIPVTHLVHVEVLPSLHV